MLCHDLFFNNHGQYNYVSKSFNLCLMLNPTDPFTYHMDCSIMCFYFFSDSLCVTYYIPSSLLPFTVSAEICWVIHSRSMAPQTLQYLWKSNPTVQWPRIETPSPMGFAKSLFLYTVTAVAEHAAVTDTRLLDDVIACGQWPARRSHLCYESNRPLQHSPAVSVCNHLSWHLNLVWMFGCIYLF